MFITIIHNNSNIKHYDNKIQTYFIFFIQFS